METSLRSVRLRLCSAAVLAILVGPAVVGAAFAPTKILREGQAMYHAIDPTQLPAGLSRELFAGEVSGETFDLFVRHLDAQTLTIELGFIDSESTGPQQHTFSVAANGTPLDPNLDVWSKAGGTFKPWVMRVTYSHSGGGLALQLNGLAKPAFISYIRITDRTGGELAFGTAADWKKAERLTLLDSRSRPFHKTKVGALAFFNVDHSPVGSWSTFVYGMEASGGVQVCKEPGGMGTLMPHQGVIVAMKRGGTERIMPFASVQPSLPQADWIQEAEVKRTLGACTDTWQLPLGVSWSHYSPVWSLPDWDRASVAEKRRFVLPVTWMQYRLDNRSGQEELQLLFSLEQAAVRAAGWAGFDGYLVDQDSAIAIKSGEAELLTAEEARQQFAVQGATSAFCVHVPPGEEKVITFYIAQFRPGNISELSDQPLQLMCSALYADWNEILRAAAEDLPAAIARCAEMDQTLAHCGQDEERRFLAADALHSYQFNTVLYAAAAQQPVWAVIEGEDSFINTFDLTVDHVFYELAMHPWTVRNELDLFLKTFSYTDQLYRRGQTEVFPGGLGFSHDMGSHLHFSNPQKGAAYRTLMTQEELQNWILCAALYWRRTGDNHWLEQNRATFKRALQSMERRDDVDPAKRDGITTYLSRIGSRTGEITTYDAMDASLQHPDNSLYIAVKSFSCYAMLRPVFEQLGDGEAAQEAHEAETYTAKGILSHWDESRHCFPAIFDGHTQSVIIPAVEGLVYPYVMGLTEAVSSDGPNADLIRHLRTHMETILVPGVCVDAHTGAWNLSSTSSTTWQSKVYLNQFVTENILGLKNPATGLDADSAQYAYEILGSPDLAWSDQIYTDSHVAYGCRHYPRGVTSALWWLWSPKASAP